MAIKFFFTDVSITLNERNKLKLFIKQLFNDEQEYLQSLSYIFCSDQYLLGINKEFLQHDDYTDIITFTLSEPSMPIEGEIYISIDRIKDNAHIHNVGIREELHRVIFHGALHLCGYKDKVLLDKQNMTAGEDKYLGLYFK